MNEKNRWDTSTISRILFLKSLKWPRTENYSQHGQYFLLLDDITVLLLLCLLLLLVYAYWVEALIMKSNDLDIVKRPSIAQCSKFHKKVQFGGSHNVCGGSEEKIVNNINFIDN